MTVTKGLFFSSYKDVRNDKVSEYFESILEKFIPVKKHILLFVQCSKIKPYSSSLSHGYIRKSIYELTGYDPIKSPQKVPIQIIVISSLIGPVPYEFENDEIPSNYNLSVNKITKNQFDEIKPVLIKRISEFISRIQQNYTHIVFFVKNNYRIICEEVNKLHDSKYIILPKRDLHMIREAWVELKFTLLELLKKRIILQPIPKELLQICLMYDKLKENSFELILFNKYLSEKKTMKQLRNYSLTLRKIGILQKDANKFKLKEELINYLQQYKGHYSDLSILNNYILKFAEVKFNLKYILYELYVKSHLKIEELSKIMKINKFSINIYLELMIWINLVKKHKGVFSLTQESINHLNGEKFLRLIDDKLRITDFS